MSREIKFILSVFLVSRILLTFVGVYSRNNYDKTNTDWYEWRYHKYVWLDIWSVWDSGWYLDIAENGYSAKLNSNLPKKVVYGQTNLGFFPLYPLLMRATSNLLGGYYLAGIIISNLSLILSSLILFKLVSLEFDIKTAKKTILFLYLFPTSFILSGIFSESLFLLLLTASFYFAYKNRWLLAGIAGYFLALTRVTGILMLIPLMLLYLQKRRSIRADLLYFLLIPLGLLTFMYFTHTLAGNWFAYFQAKQIGWSTSISSPITTLALLFMGNPSTKIIAIFILFEISILLFTFKTLKPVYSVLSALILLSALSSTATAISIPRMSVIIFPLYIALASFNKSNVIYITLGILQIIFMMAWSNGHLII